MFFSVNLHVPGSSHGFGEASAVPDIASRKTIIISGQWRGSYIVLGSQDGIAYAPVAAFSFNSPVDLMTVGHFNHMVRFLRVERRSPDSAAVNVSGNSSMRIEDAPELLRPTKALLVNELPEVLPPQEMPAGVLRRRGML